METKGISFESEKAKSKVMTFERRQVGEEDVHIEIIYCGICHSDVHSVHNDWKGANYPMIPGHEILGKVAKVGSKVTKFKEGDLAGVGCFVDSCRKCQYCKEGDEQHCVEGMVQTYNAKDKHTGKFTYGGYSTQIVVNHNYVLSISDKFKDLKGVAPLLCAGITTYAPLKRYESKVKGRKIGIVGFGGLGHMAIKIALSMGAEVTVLSTSPNKEADAKKMGVQNFVISKDKEAMKKIASSLDFILDTVSASHPVTDLVDLLAVDGVLVLVGGVTEPFELSAMPIFFSRRNVTGSLIGGIRETQEMLDYCADKGIICDYEVIKADEVDKAYERLGSQDAVHRFVIDIETLRK